MAKKPAAPLLNVADAAAELDVTPRQVRNLIASGALKGTKLGRDYVIQRADLALLPKTRKPGPKAAVPADGVTYVHEVRGSVVSQAFDNEKAALSRALGHLKSPTMKKRGWRFVEIRGGGIDERGPVIWSAERFAGLRLV